MKIFYIITRSDTIGGASVHLLDLASGAQKAGHEVTILVGGNGVFVDLAREMGLHCVSLYNLVREINLVKDMLGFFEIRRELIKAKPDIVHLHSSKAGMIGRLAAKSLSIPAIFTAHGWAFTEGVSENRRLLYRNIERYMARFSDKIIAVSDYDRELALSFGVGDEKIIKTIHNGMPELVPRKLGYTQNRPVRLVMVARFDAPKNQKALLEAVESIMNLDWVLEFIGDGPQLSSAKDMAENLSFNGKVVFSGACDDVADRLATSDIFVLISSWEGLPLTILEAMRSGLPVVASKVGGVPEAVVDGETGFLIERDDKRSLIQALTRLIRCPSLRLEMGEKGKVRFEEKFTFKNMLSETIAVYDEAVQGKK